jgi:hypothetical protein
MPEIPTPPTFTAKSDPIVPKKVLPPPIPEARTMDPAKDDFYKKSYVSMRALDHHFDLTDVVLVDLWAS